MPAGGLTDGVAELRDALATVRAVALGEMIDDEIDRVKRAIAMLDRALHEG